jgi:hypothetical protein
MKTIALLGVVGVVGLCGGTAWAVGPLDPTKTTIDMPASGHTNVTIYYTIHAKDSNGNNLTTGGATFSGTFTAFPGGDGPIASPITDNNDGTYSGSWTGLYQGNYVFLVQYLNPPSLPAAILGSPTVTSLRDFNVDPTNTFAYGPGLTGGRTNVQYQTFVQMRDLFNQLVDPSPPPGLFTFQFLLTGPQTIVPTFTDDGHGTLTAVYTVTQPGTYTFHITVNGVDISGSPYFPSFTGCGRRSCTVSGNMTHADLSGCDFGGQNLSGLNFDHADLTCANLAGANVAGANLNHTDLTNVCAKGTNFSNANLSRSDALNADFTNATLSGANTNDISDFNTNTTPVCSP